MTRSNKALGLALTVLGQLRSHFLWFISLTFGAATACAALLVCTRRAPT